MYYRLHALCNLVLDFSYESDTLRCHLLTTVIDNLTLAPNYYQHINLYYGLTKIHPFYKVISFKYALLDILFPNYSTFTEIMFNVIEIIIDVLQSHGLKPFTSFENNQQEILSYIDNLKNYLIQEKSDSLSLESNSFIYKQTEINNDDKQTKINDDVKKRLDEESLTQQLSSILKS